MRPKRRGRPRNVTLAGLLVTLVTALIYRYFGGPAGEGRPNQTTKIESAARSNKSASPGKFDFYLLDLTHEAAWCEDGNEKRGQCRALDESAHANRPLVLHGLWPEYRQPGSYPEFCQAGPLQLSAGLREQLVQVMPGATEGLDRHEWRKHGSCTGLDAETYFSESIRLADRVAKPLRSALQAAAPETRVSSAALREAVRRVDPELSESIVFVCKNLRTENPRHRQRPYLISVRACIDNDGPGGRPASWLNCTSVGRRDQGCGQTFFVDDL